MSQRLEIQRHLAKGHSITPMQAYTRFGCLTLSQRIREIRARGFNVRSELVQVGEKRVARYSIKK
jgi:hypothetical protein